MAGPEVLNADKDGYKHFEFNVKMTCTGCSGAIERALKKNTANGVAGFNVSLPDQLVKVWGTIAYDDLLAIIKKTGKQVLDGKEVLDGNEVQVGEGAPDPNLPDTVELTAQ